MTYGHMTLEEWERRGGEKNLALEERGIWYRITDYHIVRGLDVPRVNYQAEEMTDYEVRQMQAEKAVEPEPEPEPVVEEPQPPVLEPSPASVPSDKPRVPTLREYAKQRGRRTTHQATVMQYYRDYPRQKPL